MKTFEIVKKTLDFKFEAGTSRGVYTKRDIYYIIIKDKTTGTIGVGEAAPIPKLSCDYLDNFFCLLRDATYKYIDRGYIDYDELKDYPSILMALETAEMQLKRGSFIFVDNAFTQKKIPIQINGLVWMGDYSTMYQRLRDKIESGFRCIKIKIGAINFEEEHNLIRSIRKDFKRNDLEIRVDANCAFTKDEAIEKIEILSSYDIHSIEQPIKVGNWEDMCILSSSSPIDIALDEELIGINSLEEKERMLSAIMPKYIVLKPSLHGGIRGTHQWIELANRQKIGFWITSALESNVGLNVISQIASMYPINIAQGLGTGNLFNTNAPSPLSLVKDNMYFDDGFSYHDNISRVVRWIKE